MKEITSTDSRFGTPPKFSARDEVTYGLEEKKTGIFDIPKVKLEFQNEHKVSRAHSGELHANRLNIIDSINRSDPG